MGTHLISTFLFLSFFEVYNFALSRRYEQKNRVYNIRTKGGKSYRRCPKVVFSLTTGAHYGRLSNDKTARFT